MTNTNLASKIQPIGGNGMYNKSEIMRNAWATYRERVAYLKSLNPILGAKLLASYTFADALKLAWLNAKHQAKDRRTPLERAKHDLFVLECKDRWDGKDFETSSQLQAEIARLEAETVSVAPATIVAKAA